MDRWTGVLRVALDHPTTTAGAAHFQVAASLCFSPSSRTLTVPSVNTIFFKGDRVEGTGNTVIDELSDSSNIARLLVSKFGGGGGAVNAWVLAAAAFNGPFALYREFVPSVDSWGNPRRYDPDGFPASTSVVNLLSKCVQQTKDVISSREAELPPKNICCMESASCFVSRTILLGFSKGGMVLNHILTEFARLKPKSAGSLLDSERPSAGGIPEGQDEIFPFS